MILHDSQVTVTDLFCGAGGWTEGAEQAGALVRYGVNHWQRACDTYELNHPAARVDCNDISSTNPGRYPRTDILIASPECTTHSPAGGSRPRRSLFTDDDDPALIAELARIERSRVTMVDVIRFAEHHRYDAVIVENVVEVRRWELFDWWLTGMHNLGYEHHIVYMNSMVAWPTPQSRDRIYMVFWRKGNKKPDLRFDVPAWCPHCEKQVSGIQSWKNPAKPWGKYRTQYVYRCPSCATIAWPFVHTAATAIDWSLPAPRIGDRKRPLADATMARIRAGLEKFGHATVVAAAGNTWERRPGVRAWPIEAPLPTQATTAQHAIVADPAFLAVMRSDRPRSQSLRDPLPTVAASGSYAGLVVPLRTHGRAELAGRSVMPTIVAGKPNHALLVPAGGTWTEEALPVGDRPMRARTSRENEALVVPPFIAVARQGENRTYGVDEPFTTFTVEGTQHWLVQPPGFVMRNNGGGAEMATSLEEPLRTMTGAGHQSIVALPFLVDYHGNGRAQSVEGPMGTVDTGDRRGLVMPELDVDDCGFRMLEPHEIKRAMAFGDDYVITGNKREQVKQCGNAVTPPVSRTLLPRVMETLA